MMLGRVVDHEASGMAAAGSVSHNSVYQSNSDKYVQDLQPAHCIYPLCMPGGSSTRNFLLLLMICSYSYYQLQPHEEQLLASVMSRDDTALEQQNPFDLSTVVLDDNSIKELEVVTAQLAQQSSRCLSALSSSIDRNMSVLLSEHTAVDVEHSAAAASQAAEHSAATAALHAGSYRPSTAGSSHSASSNRTKHTIAEIDTLLHMLRQGSEQQDLHAASEWLNSATSLPGKNCCGYNLTSADAV